ncbi:MAG: HAMP domain-containing histidine kinase, partial [Bacteroidales bacterium]|nr:HAMP domain-containing histidine kinase [Bacteroidales bacterium]
RPVMPLWQIILLVVLAAVIAAVLAAVHVRRSDIKKVGYMMDALEDGELNFRFQEKNKFNRTLNRIRTIFEKQRQQHEQDSWTKLIRVLTHEIMNTVSPIASLSDAMAKSVDENGHSELDIKAGLETISDSSKNLIGFVQTYRQLSGVAKPVRKALFLQDLMDNVISLNSEFAASCGAVCTYRPEESDLMVYADEGQISQILINLIKNALQAGAKHIDITARMGKDDEVIVRVANDGEAIPVSAQEQIFIPFYTTKKEGSGIGLSISRQIMRNHNGSIELVRSDDKQTIFELRFR